jgi:hypothetical protein
MIFHAMNFMKQKKLNAKKEKGFTSEDANPCSIWCGWQDEASPKN